MNRSQAQNVLGCKRRSDPDSQICEIRFVLVKQRKGDVEQPEAAAREFPPTRLKFSCPKSWGCKFSVDSAAFPHVRNRQERSKKLQPAPWYQCSSTRRMMQSPSAQIRWLGIAGTCSLAGSRSLMHKKHCSEAHGAELFKYLVSPRAAAVNGNCECSAPHRSQPFARVSALMRVCALLLFLKTF